MNIKEIKVTLIDGSEWIMDNSVLESFYYTEKPESVISSFIRGSKGPLVKVHSKSGDESAHINAHFIIKLDVTYK